MAGVSLVPGRLLSALLLACAGLVLTGPAAEACSCQVPSIAKAAREADVVFTGVMLGERRDGRRIELALEVDRIYQGTVATSPLDVASPSDSCGLTLTRDARYAVFAVDTRAGLVSEKCYGTTRARARTLTELEQALGSGKKYQPPTPEPAEPRYERVAGATPPDFTRVAAPGGAMVLVGLLGLLVVRRRG